MASTAMARPARDPTNLLILLLGAALFLNYVDRGALAVGAPLIKGEFKLSATDFGIAVSAFFWVYAPVQLVLGWLCDRFSVYALMAGGIALWAGSTFLTGFAGGFLSLLVLRVMLGIGESIVFPASSKMIARHIPADRRGTANAAVAAGLALGPALGTLAGGLIIAFYGWRAMFLVFGIATLLWLIPWRRAVLALPPDEAAHGEKRASLGQLVGKWPLWSMSIVHALGNYCFYFLLAWLPLYLVQSRGFSITQMTLLASLGYGVQAACALAYGHLSDRWTRSGRSEAACRRFMMVVSQLLAAGAILTLGFATTAPMIGLLLCIAGAASASLSLNIYAVAQMFAGRRAAGTWVGFQNALGNVSGIVGPVITGLIVDRAGYQSAFIVTAAVAAFGALWWAIGVPEIRQVELD